VNNTQLYYQRGVDIAFVAVSPIRGHQVGFSVAASSDEMQLYFRPNDVITLTWLPREMAPSHITDDFEDLMITVELHQQRSTLTATARNWQFLAGSQVRGIANSGTVQYTIPNGLRLTDCDSGGRTLCPVVFRLSATIPSPAASPPGGTIEVSIWSAVAYLQSGMDSSVRDLCQGWSMSDMPGGTNTNEIPNSILNSLMMCPPTLAQAAADNRLRIDTMESELSDFVTGYSQAAMKFYHPGSSVCFIEILLEGRLIMGGGTEGGL
jgi:hypothetical protein